LIIASLNEVKIEIPPSVHGKTYRAIQEVIVQASNSQAYLKHLIRTGIPPSGIVNLGAVHDAKYAKLTIIPSEDNPEYPIGVYK
jgi:hypothetical protein